MNHEKIISAVSILVSKGLNHCVISPGSRSAPLTLAFARHEEVKKTIVIDERSAAFIALGIAQETQKPVALVCTSGSAVLNYSPAIAEAFYQGVPLLILTADRPPEWIDQQDGQSIQQSNIYNSIVKASFDFPSQDDHEESNWHGNRIVNEAFNLSMTGFYGPVHINFPFREPFYPAKSTDYPVSSKKERIIEYAEPEQNFDQNTVASLVDDISGYSRILIVIGQHKKCKDLSIALERFSNHHKIPVCSGILSNIDHFDGLISQHDLFLSNPDSQLNPDLIITIGKSILSKPLKSFLRNIDDLDHWHFEHRSQGKDTFRKLTRVFSSNPLSFFEQASTYESIDCDVFLNQWKEAQNNAGSKLKTFLELPPVFSELSVIKKITESLPSDSILHLSNSMTVRYFNLLSKYCKAEEIFCNRGVSGIDGSVGTAVGAAMVNNKTITLVTGDLAFFYDRNSLWLTNLPRNLRIIVMNNQGGGIFGMIPGSSDQPELKEYFETPHQLSAHNTAKDYGLGYACVQSLEEINPALKGFFETSENAKLLEVKTNISTNKMHYGDLKKALIG